MAALLQGLATVLFMIGGVGLMLRQAWAWRSIFAALVVAVVSGWVASQPALAAASLVVVLSAGVLVLVGAALLLRLLQSAVKVLYGEEAAGHVAGTYVVRFLDRLTGRRHRR